VNGLTTDRNGTLWAATENGVYHFLGSGFERFGADQGIAELDALDVVSDANGIVWAGTEGNLYYGDGQRFFPAGRQAIKVGRQGRLVIECTGTSVTLWTGDLHYKSLAVIGA
jgi:ligand-binding sensor domain-containing protein